MSKSIEINPIITNSLVVGEWLGVTDRHVRRLAEGKIISTVARGRYDLKDCVRKYCSYQQQQLLAKEPSKEVKLNLDTEKALHEKAKREKAELQLQIMRGEVHLGSDVEQVMTDMISRARTKLLALPAKVAPAVLGYDNIAKIQAILNRHVEEALQELSDYDPELFINDSVVQGDADAI